MTKRITLFATVSVIGILIIIGAIFHHDYKNPRAPRPEKEAESTESTPEKSAKEFKAELCKTFKDKVKMDWIFLDEVNVLLGKTPDFRVKNGKYTLFVYKVNNNCGKDIGILVTKERYKIYGAFNIIGEEIVLKNDIIEVFVKMQEINTNKTLNFYYK